MAGIRISWIDDSGPNPVQGIIAKEAYRKIGEWAFALEDNGMASEAKRKKWLRFLNRPPRKRLLYLAETLTDDFGSYVPGALTAKSRILIKYDDEGPSMLDVGVGVDPYGPVMRAYYIAHELRFVEDGEKHTSVVFDGLPTILNYADYLEEYAKDEGETGNTPAELAKQRKRILRVFAMTLFTRCR